MIYYKKKEKGAIIIIGVLALAILALLSSYFLRFTLIDYKISESQKKSAQGYYLAEAGINEALWKLKNDAEWKENFENQSVWSASFNRENVFFENSSYFIEIENLERANAQIISTAVINNSIQRVIKIKVFKTLGSLTCDSGLFSGGSSENIDIHSSVINIYNGNLFSNKNLNIKFWSVVRVYDNLETVSSLEGKTLAGGNLNVLWSSSLTTESSCSKDICESECLSNECPPDEVLMPMVDFDSDSPDSYKNKAQANEDAGLCSVLCNAVECATKCVYTKSEFENLLWQIGKGGTLTLNNDITYITGAVDLKGKRYLVINGVLATDSTIDIGTKWCWRKGWTMHCGNNQITVNDIGAEFPSGILTKGKMNFGLFSSYMDTNIVGLVYANNEINFVSAPNSFNVTGGILARKISTTSIWQGLNIYLNNAIINKGVWAGSAPPEGQDSPIIAIERWEESY
ncbi:MAG: hypothetical protein U9Q27_00575 [Patescibacteria group bacterium]|nr:hypothetical protein [Patescibacteria group bacterium]